MRNTFVLIVLLTLAACGFTKMEDVSDESPYQSAVGRNVVTLVPLLAIDVTTDPNYKGPAEFTVLVQEPGFAGPEVIERRLLPKGTRFKIVGVQKARTLFREQLVLIVQLVQMKEHRDIPIRIKLTSSITTDNLGLSRDVYMVERTEVGLP